MTSEKTYVKAYDRIEAAKVISILAVVASLFIFLLIKFTAIVLLILTALAIWAGFCSLSDLFSSIEIIKNRAKWSLEHPTCTGYRNDYEQTLKERPAAAWVMRVIGPKEKKIEEKR